MSSTELLVNTEVSFSTTPRLSPSSSRSDWTASRGSFSNLSTRTQVAANFSSGIPSSVNTSPMTSRLLILTPTSAAVRPTPRKNVTMALSNSASASTPSTPHTSMFHW